MKIHKEQGVVVVVKLSYYLIIVTHSSDFLVGYPSTRLARFGSNIFGIVIKEEVNLPPCNMNIKLHYLKGKISKEKIDPLLETPNSNHTPSSSSFSNKIIASRKRKTTQKTIEVGTSPINSTTHMARKLFPNNPTPTIAMDRPWIIASFKPLDLSSHFCSPHPFPNRYHEWIPKFNGTNFSTAKKRIHNLYWELLSAKLIVQEDVVMMLFSLSFYGYVRGWYHNLPNN